MDRSSSRAIPKPDFVLAPTEPEPALGRLSGPVDSPILAIARRLWARRVELGKAVAVSILLATAIAILIPNRYRVVVRLMPPDTTNTATFAMLQALTSKAGLGTSLVGDLLGMRTSGDMFIGILRSRTVEDRLINRFDLRSVYWYKTYQDTRDKLESNTDISTDRKTGIISISVSDRDRMRAAALAQAYVEELDRLVAEVSTSSARRERIFLEQRLDVVHKDLQDASLQFSTFASKTGTLDIQVQGKAMVEAAARLQGQLIAAQSELQGLEQIYTPQNVRVRSLRARVAELQSQLNKLGGQNGSASDTPDAGALYPSIRQLPVVGLQYAELFRRVKIQETVFEILTQQYEMAKVQEAKEIPSVKVLDAAAPPEKKSWPPRALLVLLGAALGFLLAGCWIVGTEIWAETDPAEPHKEFLQSIWTELEPTLKTKTTSLREWLSGHRNGRKDFDAPNPEHRKEPDAS